MDLQTDFRLVFIWFLIVFFSYIPVQKKTVRTVHLSAVSALPLFLFFGHFTGAEAAAGLRTAGAGSHIRFRFFSRTVLLLIAGSGLSPDAAFGK
ncbi:hypothetical protein [uncultured Megasphaera sp.]|uniref:Uncharacterized protein n=1 Tax=Megasphaera vaginalis (ex Srinivasan et al. 2021) TaxID=1111454 RepID=U7UTV4_9FIRM|nr:hypothetical protein [uncultured Megasphaera sp.]ERT62750.1 hypothetical protein HMPREF1250_0118 [Megasphaera vaginalis (ex Srinivasan et al. 2021)]